MFDLGRIVFTSSIVNGDSDTRFYLIVKKNGDDLILSRIYHDVIRAVSDEEVIIDVKKPIECVPDGLTTIRCVSEWDKCTKRTNYYVDTFVQSWRCEGEVIYPVYDEVFVREKLFIYGTNITYFNKA